ncbi:hypothetical protein NNM65_23555, partial [Escherichia coli]|nr:hypothetical protein [Escherichia coli]
DYLLYLREDANWHNRDHSISVIREGTLWCLVSSVAGANTCHGGSMERGEKKTRASFYFFGASSGLFTPLQDVAKFREGVSKNLM